MKLILRIWGAKEKYFQGAEDFFRDFGRSMHNFRDQGSTDPGGGGGRLVNEATSGKWLVLWEHMFPIASRFFL